MTNPTPKPVEAWAVCEGEVLCPDTIRRTRAEAIESCVMYVRWDDWNCGNGIDAWKKFRKTHRARAIRVTIAPKEPTE